MPASDRAPGITYPVHKTLVYGEGARGFLSSMKIMEDTHSIIDKNMLLAIVNNQWQVKDLDPDLNIISIDLTQAESAITELRRSINDSMTYERKWIASNVSTVAEGLLWGTQGSDLAIKPAVGDLVQVLLANVDRAILLEGRERHVELSSTSVSQFTRQGLEEAITIWAETAHIELHDSLENAFLGRNWRKLKWWKLFWRVDDVSMLTTDILQRSWLVEAEKDVIWIGGRFGQAGLLGSQEEAIDSPKLGSASPFPFPEYTNDMVPSPSEETVIYNPTKPWPQQIALARHSLSSLGTSSLQTLSQRLLLQTITTMTTTLTLSFLVYFSLSSTSIYEAGTIAAFGLVYSLQRLQRKWESAKARWIGDVREEGRKVLRGIEDTCRAVIREGGKPKIDEVGEAERAVALEAIKGVRVALEKVKGDQEH